MRIINYSKRIGHFFLGPGAVAFFQKDVQVIRAKAHINKISVFKEASERKYQRQSRSAQQKKRQQAYSN